MQILHITVLFILLIFLNSCKSPEQKKREAINQKIFPQVHKLIEEKNYTTAIEVLRQAFGEDMLNPEIYPVLFKLLATIEQVDFIAGAIRDVANKLIIQKKLPKDSTPEYLPLINAIKDNLNTLQPPERIALIRGLALYPSPWTLELIKIKTQDSDRDVRQAAVTALANYPSEAVLPILKEATHDSWWFVRAEAVSGLGRYRDESTSEALNRKIDVVDHLFNMLKDEDASVRYAAENGLLTLATEKTKERYIAYFKDSDPIKQRTAAICLASFQLPEVTPYLISTLPNVQDRDVIARIIRALGLTGDSRALPLLRSLLTHNEKDVRGEAIVALGLQADRNSLGKLEMISRDGNESMDIRRAAQMAIKQITQALEQRSISTAPQAASPTIQAPPPQKTQ